MACFGCHSGPVKYWGLRTKRVGGLTFVRVDNPYPTLSPETIYKLVSQLDPDRATGAGAVSMLISQEGAPWDELWREGIIDVINPGPDEGRPRIYDPAKFPVEQRHLLRAAWYLRVRDLQEYVWYDSGDSASIQRLNGPVSPRLLGGADIADARLVMVAHGEVGGPLRPEIRWFVRAGKEPDEDAAIRLTARIVRDFALEGAQFKGVVCIRTDGAFDAHYGQGDIVEPFRHVDVREALKRTYWECSFESPGNAGKYKCKRLVTSESPRRIPGLDGGSDTSTRNKQPAGTETAGKHAKHDR